MEYKDYRENNIHHSFLTIKRKNLKTNEVHIDDFGNGHITVNFNNGFGTQTKWLNEYNNFLWQCNHDVSYYYTSKKDDPFGKLKEKLDNE